MADKKKAKKQPALRYTGKAQPGAPDWSKLTPEQARAAYAAEVERERVRKNPQKLSGGGPVGLGQEYFAQHPVQADYANKALGLLGTDLNSAMQFGAGVQDSISGMLGGGSPEPKMFGMTPEGRPFDESRLGSGGSSEHVKTAPGADVTKSMPSLLDQHKTGRAGAIRQSLGPSLDKINKQLGIDPDEAETILHNFADTEEGRSLSEGLLKGKGGDAAAAYRSFAKEWADYSMENGQTGSLEIDDPVILSASSVPPAELAKQIKGAGGKPVVINEASDLGFRSDQVVLMERKGGKKKTEPESARTSIEPPVLTKDEFIDVVKLIGGGRG